MVKAVNQGKVMSSPLDESEELAKIEQAISAQEALQGVLPDETLQPMLAALRQKREILLAMVSGSGAAAQTASAAAGAFGLAIRGDVHGNVYMNLTPERLTALWGKQALADKALQQATRQYFEFLVDRYRYLDFRGMGVSDRVALRLPLLDVYIPGRARVETPSGETWERVRLAGRRLSAEEAAAMGRLFSESQALMKLLIGSSALVVLGDPGAGKTSFLKYLALSVAAGHGTQLQLGERLPILLPLSAYANALEEKDMPLLDFAAVYPAQRGLALPLSELLEQALENGTALLLLDGLDEIRESRQRRLAVDRLQDFCSRYREKGNRLVLTSRIVGYREVRPTGEGWKEATLVDFEEKEIVEFITRWTAGLEMAARGQGNAAEEAARRERKELLAAVERNEGVRALATNPLLLTILALMKRQVVTLPERRVQIYQTYVETLFQHWNLARGLDGRGGRDLDRVETLRILAPLALWMHETSPGVGLVTEWQVIDQLTAILSHRGKAEPERAAREFFHDVREYTGLLLDRGGQRYGFIHLTFQEYMAAVALASRGAKELKPLIDELALRVGHSAWTEVSRLTIGYLAIVQGRDEAAAEILEELLSRRPGLAGEAEILAGEATIDVGEAGLPDRSRQRVVEALLGAMTDDTRVEAARRLRCGELLGRLGDSRGDVMTVDGIWGALCEVPAGSFWMGSETKDRHAAADEMPRHLEEISYSFRLARYPVTVAQFREYVAKSGEKKLFLPGLPNDPVSGVSWDEAMGFCRWLTRRWHATGDLQTDWEVTLPSEMEWEKAARGEDGRLYPWGNAFDVERANVLESNWVGASAVGVYPQGRSPVGCEEMSGNVWEWTRSMFRSYFGSRGYRESLRPSYMLRGGASAFDNGFSRCAARFELEPTSRDNHIGFRVVVIPFSLNSALSTALM